MKDNQKRIGAGESTVVEAAHRRKDGTVVPVEIHARRTEYQGRPAILAVVRDLTERKRIEEAYRVLVEHSLQGLIIVGREGVLFANPALERILGYSVEEVCALSADQALGLAHPEDREFVRERFWARLAGGTPLSSYEFRVVRRGGGVRWLAASASHIEYLGQPAVQLAVVDITEHKQAEDALRASERRFRELADNMPDAFWAMDSQFRYTYWNRASEELTGIPASDAIGRTLREVFPDVRDTEAERLYDRVLRAGRPETAENNYEIGGKRYVFELVAYPFGDGVAVLARDITERRRAEEEYRTIIRTSIDGFWIVDMQGRFLDVNDAYCRLIGYSRDELLKMGIPDVEAVEKPGDTARRIQKIMKVGGDRFETRHRCKDGRIIDIEVSTTCTKAGGVRLFAFLRDITERKAAEQELVHSREQLRALAARFHSEREQVRKRIAREIHDDVGHALTALKLDVAWLDRRLSEEQGKVRDVQALTQRLDSMGELVDATIESMRRVITQLRPGILDVGLVEAIEWQARDFQSRTGIKCSILACPEAVKLDEEVATSVFRIFQEILDNVARHAQATEVLVSLEERADALVLTVRDNGRGIREDEMSRADSFGLMGIRERALAFGGEVSITGSPGQGTTVIVHIPGRGALR